MEEDTSINFQQTSNSQTTDDVQTLQNRIFDLERQIEIYKKSLQDSVECLAKKDKELEQVKANNDDLKKEVEKLNAELEKFRKSNEESTTNLLIASENIKIEPQEPEKERENRNADIKQECASPVDPVTEESSQIMEHSSQEQPAQIKEKKRDGEQSGLSIAEDLKATAEAALQDTGYVYDENSGLYYDSKSGYYYDPVKQLFYEPNSGTYFYYNGETEKYEFHSQVDLSQYTSGTTYAAGMTHSNYYHHGYQTQNQHYDYNTYSRYQDNYSDTYHRHRHSNDSDRHHSDKYRYERRHRSSSRERRRQSSSREERHYYDRHDKRRSESRKKDERKSPKSSEKSKKHTEHKKEKKRKSSPSRDKENNKKKKKTKKKKEKSKDRDEKIPTQNTPAEQNSKKPSDNIELSGNHFELPLNEDVANTVIDENNVNEEGEIVDDSDNEDVNKKLYKDVNKIITSRDKNGNSVDHKQCSDVMNTASQAEKLSDEKKKGIDEELYDINVRQRQDKMNVDTCVNTDSKKVKTKPIKFIIKTVSSRTPTPPPHPLFQEDTIQNTEKSLLNCKQTQLESKSDDNMCENQFGREKPCDPMSTGHETKKLIDESGVTDDREEVDEELYDIFYKQGQQEDMDVDQCVTTDSTKSETKPIKFVIKTATSRTPTPPLLKSHPVFQEESDDSGKSSPPNSKETAKNAGHSLRENKYYHKEKSKHSDNKKAKSSVSISTSKHSKLRANDDSQTIAHSGSHSKALLPRSSGLLSNIGKMNQKRKFKSVKKLSDSEVDHSEDNTIESLTNETPLTDPVIDKKESDSTKNSANTKLTAVEEVKSAGGRNQRQLSKESASVDSTDSSSSSSVCSGESELESGEICDSSSSSSSEDMRSLSPIEVTVMDESSDNEEQVYEYKADFKPIENEAEVASKWPPCIRIIVTDSDVIEPGTLFIVTCTGATVGREKNMGHTVLIPDLNISKSHAQINYDMDKNRYEIVDQASQNGTYLNEERLSEPKLTSKPSPLNHGDTLQFGCTRLLLHIHQGMETCDDCEPGQVKAQMSLQNQENKEKTILSKEEKMKRHKEELKNIKKKYGLKNSAYTDNMAAIKNSGYTDKAEERRRTVGSDNPYQPDEAPASVHRPLSVENKGHKLLMKMGWSEGQSLGKGNAGIQEPISVKYRSQQTAGLGFGGAGEGSIDNVAGIGKRQKWLQAQQRYNDSKDKKT